MPYYVVSRLIASRGLLLHHIVHGLVHVFSPRICNKVAYALAALGADGVNLCRVWHEDVKVLVASDSTGPMN
jgi:hypothetical protein